MSKFSYKGQKTVFEIRLKLLKETSDILYFTLKVTFKPRLLQPP